MSAPRTASVFAIIFVVCAVLLGHAPVSAAAPSGANAPVCGSLFAPRNGSGVGLDRILSDGVALECQAALMQRAAYVSLALIATLTAGLMALLFLTATRALASIRRAGGAEMWWQRTAFTLANLDDRRLWPAPRLPSVDVPDLWLLNITMPDVKLPNPRALVAGRADFLRPRHVPSLRAPLIALLIGVLALGLLSTIDDRGLTDLITAPGGSNSAGVLVSFDR